VNITTKYDIGQELWFTIPAEIERQKCECCGHIRCRAKSYKVNENPLIIESIAISAYGITYYNDLGGHFTEDFVEAENPYFTTRESAQAECDRRNKAKGVDKA